MFGNDAPKQKTPTVFHDPIKGAPNVDDSFIRAADLSANAIERLKNAERQEDLKNWKSDEVVFMSGEGWVSSSKSSDVVVSILPRLALKR